MSLRIPKACRKHQVALIASLAVVLFFPASAHAQGITGPGLQPILTYISSAWDTLTRSMTSCDSVVDPKLKAAPVLYLPKDFPDPPAVQNLPTDCNVRAYPLP